MRRLLLALCILHCALCIAAADPATLGSIPRTNTVYTAAQVDALLEGAGGGVDDQTVSNLVGRVVAEAGSSAAATETWRIILADHQRRLDALEDSDGTDALTQMEGEALVNAMFESFATNTLQPAALAYSSAQSAMTAAATAYSQAQAANYGYVPLEPTTVNSATITATTGQSIPLTRTAATRRYRTGSATVLTISSFTGLSQNPCWLILSGYSSVTWPDGAVLTNGAYETGKVNYFRVCYVYDTTFIHKVTAK